MQVNSMQVLLRIILLCINAYNYNRHNDFESHGALVSFKQTKLITVHINKASEYDYVGCYKTKCH